MQHSKHAHKLMVPINEDSLAILFPNQTQEKVRFQDFFVRKPAPLPQNFSID